LNLLLPAEHILDVKRPPDMTDSETNLLRRVGAKDRKAFEALYHQY